MRKVFEYAFSLGAPLHIFVAAMVLVVGLVAIGLGITIWASSIGQPLIPLAMWVGIPFWIILDGYRNRGGKE